jgi:hypothetical protein
VNSVDRLACAPPEKLAEYGVTADNSDLLNPGAEMKAACKQMLDKFRAEQMIRAAGVGSPEEFRDVLMAAVEMMGGDSASTG